MFSKLLKPLLWLLALCLAVYICICSYMFAQQRQMIFPGGSTQVAAESTDFSLQRADVLLRGWQLHPADGKARNAVIYFGGNAENIAHRRQPPCSMRSGACTHSCPSPWSAAAWARAWRLPWPTCASRTSWCWSRPSTAF